MVYERDVPEAPEVIDADRNDINDLNDIEPIDITNIGMPMPEVIGYNKYLMIMGDN